MSINSIIHEIWFLFLVGLLGMMSHFLKKYQKNQLELADKSIHVAFFKYFFKVDWVNTVLAIIAYIIGFVSLWEMSQLNVFAAFSAGYMSDSIFNKAETGGK